jgi:methionine-rich copper-binding protein CopC
MSVPADRHSGRPESCWQRPTQKALTRGGGTLQTHLGSGCAILVLLLMSTTPAPARPMHVLSSTPEAEAIMQGRNAQYVVRFDGPVDHAQSRLEILRDGHVVQRLDPLLDSAADVLFASAPAPEPGRYMLHWIVKSVRDEEASEGMIAFSVSQ